MPFTLNMNPVNNGLLPDEGPYIATQKIVWGNLADLSGTDKNGYNFNLTNLQAQAQTGRFTRCQSIYIDNTCHPYPVIVTNTETGMAVTCPGFAYAVLPFLASASPVINCRFGFQAMTSLGLFSVNPTPGVTRLFFLNVPMKPLLYQTPLFGADWITTSKQANGVAASALSNVPAVDIPSAQPGFMLGISKIELTILSAGVASPGWSAAVSLKTGGGNNPIWASQFTQDATSNFIIRYIIQPPSPIFAEMSGPMTNTTVVVPVFSVTGADTGNTWSFIIVTTFNLFYLGQ